MRPDKLSHVINVDNRFFTRLRRLLQVKFERWVRRLSSLPWLSRTLTRKCLSALAKKSLRQRSQGAQGGHRGVPVWHCGDPAGWNQYKDSVPWHQGDRTKEIEELLEMPLMTHQTNAKNYFFHCSETAALPIPTCFPADRPDVSFSLTGMVQCGGDVADRSHKRFY